LSEIKIQKRLRGPGVVGVLVMLVKL
jgi:hypothetical protein